MNILSIQSHVAYGHVGNSAAVFAFQRLGVEVWPVNTVQFSNHPGYGAWRGRCFDGAMIGEIVQGIDECGVLGECDGVLSGYVGEAATGDAILDAVARVKRANPAAHYCCDPVIGDADSGVYVREGIEQFMRTSAVPAADIVTPNQFELGRLTGHATDTSAAVWAAVDALHALGPRVVLVTSVATELTADDQLDVIASDAEGRWRVRTPRLAHSAHGAGDAIAALFFALYLRKGTLEQALSLAVSSVFGLLRLTAENGARELALIAGQQEIVEPTQHFRPERL